MWEILGTMLIQYGAPGLCLLVLFYMIISSDITIRYRGKGRN